MFNNQECSHSYIIKSQKCFHSYKCQQLGKFAPLQLSTVSSIFTGSTVNCHQFSRHYNYEQPGIFSALQLTSHQCPHFYTKRQQRSHFYKYRLIVTNAQISHHSSCKQSAEFSRLQLSTFSSVLVTTTVAVSGAATTVLGTPESVGMNGQIDWQALQISHLICSLAGQRCSEA